MESNSFYTQTGQVRKSRFPKKGRMTAWSVAGYKRKSFFSRNQTQEFKRTPAKMASRN